MWCLPRQYQSLLILPPYDRLLARQSVGKALAKMRFPTTWFLTIPLALGGLALSDQFYLTVVPEDGSDSYPVTIAVVSRAALILSSALEYEAQFTFNE